MTEDAKAEYSWIDLCDKQKWSAHVQVVLLEGFIRQECLFPKLAAYAAEACGKIDSLGRKLT